MPLFDFLKSDDANFFQWFEDAASNMLEASKSFRELCYNFENPQEAVTRLHDFEHRGDDIGHDIYNKLNNTFVTPMDREDIISLYSAIDDVTDFIHSAADLMSVYKVESVPPIGQQLADCIVSCAEHVAAAVPHLRKRNELNQILPSVVEIHSLENKADELLRDGLVELFSHPEDVIHIIKWRDIYSEMEEATDKAEDIADVLRGLVIKNA
ncbi:MAG TPA: DUF47 family protein [Chloroflexia bacterium]|nr:DUF47 family protein [Chloroflexia bacterium]